MRFSCHLFYAGLIFISLFACHNPAHAPGKAQSGNRTVQDPFNRHGHLILTKHARCRMDCRHISMHEIREVLDAGTINYAKSEPAAKPDPKYALESYTEEHQHLRIIIAPSGGELVVITCIELGVEWTCDCN